MDYTDADGDSTGEATLRTEKVSHRDGEGTNHAFPVLDILRAGLGPESCGPKVE